MVPQALVKRQISHGMELILTRFCSLLLGFSHVKSDGRYGLRFCYCMAPSDWLLSGEDFLVMTGCY